MDPLVHFGGQFGFYLWHDLFASLFPLLPKMLLLGIQELHFSGHFGYGRR